MEKYQQNKQSYAFVKKGILPNDVSWAESFGKFLAQTDQSIDVLKDRNGKEKTNSRGEFLFRENLTTSQLRKFFGEIRRIQALSTVTKEDGSQEKAFDKTDILMLKPKLAYSVGRADASKEPKIKEFYEELSKGIDQVDSYAHFINFVKIVEAIVAYHKAYGGKDK